MYWEKVPEGVTEAVLKYDAEYYYMNSEGYNYPRYMFKITGFTPGVTSSLKLSWSVSQEIGQGDKVKIKATGQIGRVMLVHEDGKLAVFYHYIPAPHKAVKSNVKNFNPEELELVEKNKGGIYIPTSSLKLSWDTTIPRCEVGDKFVYNGKASYMWEANMAGIQEGEIATVVGVDGDRIDITLPVDESYEAGDSYKTWVDKGTLAEYFTKEASRKLSWDTNVQDFKVDDRVRLTEKGREVVHRYMPGEEGDKLDDEEGKVMSTDENGVDVEFSYTHTSFYFYNREVRDCLEKVDTTLSSLLLTAWNVDPLMQYRDKLEKLEDYCQYITGQDGYEDEHGVYIKDINKVWPELLGMIDINPWQSSHGTYTTWEAIEEGLKKLTYDTAVTGTLQLKEAS
jgi:hypothetical protein